MKEKKTISVKEKKITTNLFPFLCFSANERNTLKRIEKEHK